ncbi:MAG: hypothetical protein KTR21_11100 [Rhodobacteraceae bacterium]|nr:hypothetical protein [Paracoccaceae bacterium]
MSDQQPGFQAQTDAVSPEMPYESQDLARLPDQNGAMTARCCLHRPELGEASSVAPDLLTPLQARFDREKMPEARGKDMSNQQAATSIRDMAREAREDKRAGAYAFWLAIAILIAGVLDVVSTDLALAAGGAREANPVVRALQATLGGFWVVPKLLLHGVLGYMVTWFPNRPTLVSMTIVCVLVLFAAVNNFSIYFDTISRL